jgi:hypothetical protein
MDDRPERHIADTLKERNIEIIGADLATRHGFTQVPNFILINKDTARAVVVHIDEFQTFSSEAFASLLSEARKFAVHFCLANRYTDRLAPAVRAAVVANAGTLLAFRVGSRDAELLAPEFRPMDPGGLADQEPFTAWLRRGIGRDRVFAAPKLYEPLGTARAIREASRQRFGRPRAAIERQRQIRF